MAVIFYISAAVAVISTALVITRANAVHALLYFILSLFAIALIFFLLGAPFIAALEIVIYAGAIMVLFLFVVMLLILGPESTEQERRRMGPRIWIGPSFLAAVLLAELLYIVILGGARGPETGRASAKEVGTFLFGPYLLGVEIASFLLLAALVAAYHVGRRETQPEVEP